MFKTILHQLWNQRRTNGWIFLELLAVSFFLWIVIDPICVLTATKSIAPGYEAEGRMVVQLDGYEQTHPRYDAAAEDNDSMKVEHIHRVARLIRDLPEVESLTISEHFCFPNSRNWNGMTLYRDTADAPQKGSTQSQFYSFVEGYEPFTTYGIRNVHTGEYLKPNENTPGVYISENLAIALFGTNDVIGKKVYQRKHNEGELTIAGVFTDYKHLDYQQPYPLLIFISKQIKGGNYRHLNYPFVFKLKDGVDEENFKEHFRQKIASQLSCGNMYFKNITSFSDISEEMSILNGTNNKFRLNYTLIGFVGLCIFLGMLGTFWIRCNNRRSEIGVMRSMGASRQRIIAQFVTEAILLVTLAFICCLPILLHYAHEVGMYATPFSGHKPIISEKYWMNNFAEHFSIVSIIAYFILIGFSLIGTIIPVFRTSKILPADALRDE